MFFIFFKEQLLLLRQHRVVRLHQDHKRRQAQLRLLRRRHRQVGTLLRMNLVSELTQAIYVTFVKLHLLVPSSSPHCLLLLQHQLVHLLPLCKQQAHLVKFSSSRRKGGEELLTTFPICSPYFYERWIYFVYVPSMLS